MSTAEPGTRSTIDVLHGHVSVRRYTDEPVHDELLETLLEAGTRASTSSNMQAYTILSIADPELRRRLAHFCADQAHILQAAVFLVFCADLHRLELCAEMHATPTTPLGLTEALIVAVVDTTLVAQNVAIAAESVGLGMCLIGAIRHHPFEVRGALQLPPRVFALAGMTLGWPAETPEPKPRLPLGAVWHRDAYRGDDELTEYIQAYDGILGAFFEAQGIHSKDPRWTAVMAKRIRAMADREALDLLLREQGFNQPGASSASA